MKPIEHGAGPRGLAAAKENRSREARFGYMFKKPSGFGPPDDLLQQLAEAMREPEAGGELNSPIPAGFTFLGQFIDHDLTFDTTPLPEQNADPKGLTSFRTPALDLDAVYAKSPLDGVNDAADRIDPDDPAKLRITASTSSHDDLPRKDDGTANIPDPRNEENLLIAQIHLAVMQFHNAMVDHVRAQGSNPNQVFGEARRLSRWYYQWMIVHDFLPRIIGQPMIDSILEERLNRPARVKLQFYKPQNPNAPMMPVEFAAAAYRFGHSMIRPRYRVNANAGGVHMFCATRRRQPQRVSTPALGIGGRVVAVLRDPRGAAATAFPQDRRPSRSATVRPPRVRRAADGRSRMRVGSLAERNLLRGKRLGLASGQALAKEMKQQVLSNPQLGVSAHPGWQGEAPLWFYALKEAEARHQGAHLGPVGGRIVGEVILGLIHRDKASYLHPSAGRFAPAPPVSSTPGKFAMTDLLKFAGVL